MLRGVRFPEDGPWILPLTGFRVSAIAFSPDVELLLEGSEELARVGLSALADLHQPMGDVQRLDATRHGSLELREVLALIGDEVASAVASVDGALDINFKSGRRVTVAADPQGETWEITGADYKLIGTPGGVAIWDEAA